MRTPLQRCQASEQSNHGHVSAVFYAHFAANSWLADFAEVQRYQYSRDTACHTNEHSTDDENGQVGAKGHCAATLNDQTRISDAGHVLQTVFADLLLAEWGLVIELLERLTNTFRYALYRAVLFLPLVSANFPVSRLLTNPPTECQVESQQDNALFSHLSRGNCPQCTHACN